MSRFIEIINIPLYRLVFGLMISSTIASPYINGESESAIWVVWGALFMALTITTVVGGIQFSKKNQWILYILFAGIVALIYFLR